MNGKLIYRSKLYLSDSISESKLDKVKERLEKHPLRCGEYLVTLSRNPSDQLEILQARQLAQDYYRHYPPQVVGIAASREEAVAMVEKIVQECLQARGDCALKEYLSC